MILAIYDEEGKQRGHFFHQIIECPSCKHTTVVGVIAVKEFNAGTECPRCHSQVPFSIINEKVNADFSEALEQVRTHIEAQKETV